MLSPQGQCCASGYKFAKGGSCCLSGQMTPNGTCCPEGQKPSGNLCKPSSDIPPNGGNASDGGAGVCCAPGNIPVAGAACCHPAQVAKNGFCCPAGQSPDPSGRQACIKPPAACSGTVINGQCCPPGQATAAGPRQMCCPAGQKPDDRYQSTCVGPPAAAPAACPDGSPIPASGSMSRRTAFSLCTGPRATRHAVCLPEHRQAADVEARRRSDELYVRRSGATANHAAGSAAVAKLRSGTSAA